MMRLVAQRRDTAGQGETTSAGAGTSLTQGHLGDAPDSLRNDHMVVQVTLVGSPVHLVPPF
jgi:hypothetical protein